MACYEVVSGTGQDMGMSLVANGLNPNDYEDAGPQHTRLVQTSPEALRRPEAITQAALGHLVTPHYELPNLPGLVVLASNS